MRPAKFGAATIVSDCVEVPNPDCVEVGHPSRLCVGILSVESCYKVEDALVNVEDFCGLAGGRYRGTCERRNEGGALLRIRSWKYGGAFPS